MATRMRPEEIARSSALSREEKAALLRDWDNELRELMVADDENMQSSVAPRVTLTDVADAMQRLGLTHQSTPTKHG